MTELLAEISNTIYGSYPYRDGGGDKTIILRRVSNPVTARVAMKGSLYYEWDVEQAKALRDALDAFIKDALENPPSLQLRLDLMEALRILEREHSYGVRYYPWEDRWNIPEHIAVKETMHNRYDHIFRELSRLSLARNVVCFPPSVEEWVLTDDGWKALERLRKIDD